MKEEEKKEPNCLKIDNGIAPSHGFVLSLLFFILLWFMLKQMLNTVEQETVVVFFYSAPLFYMMRCRNFHKDEIHRLSGLEPSQLSSDWCFET